MKINWQTYRENFPIRYLESDFFDSELQNIIKKKNPKSILDIGGNTGTESIREFKIPIDLLDPFVSKPEWIQEQISWSSKKRYDLVFARNCINYLKLYELKKISSFLTEDGVFLANTFLNPPSKEWKERKYTTILGTEGTEKFRLKGNKIEHKLLYDKEEINHSFFYRSLQDWERIFPKVDINKYKENSLILKLEK